MAPRKKGVQPEYIAKNPETTMDKNCQLLIRSTPLEHSPISRFPGEHMIRMALSNYVPKAGEDRESTGGGHYLELEPTDLF